jgi:Bacterial PH domain
MQRTFRAAPSAYLIVVGLLSIPAIVWIFAMVWRRQLQIDALAVAVLLPLLFAAWLGSFRLVISEYGVSYRSLFGGNKTARYDEVQSIDTPRIARITGAPLGVRLRLRNGTEIAINAKPFSTEAIRVLLSSVETRRGREDG